MSIEKTITLATWNASEGQSVQLSEVVEHLRGSDVIAVQESCWNPVSNESTASKLADYLDMTVLREMPFHESLVNPDSQLAIATLASRSIAKHAKTQALFLPNPLFLKDLPDGTEPTMHRRPAIVTHVDVLTITNVHNWPEILNTDSVRQHYWLELEDTYRAIIDEYSVLCGDFNLDDLRDAMPLLTREHQLQDALPATPTVDKWASSPDHIVYGPGLELGKSSVTSLGSEHNIGQAILKFAKNPSVMMKAYGKRRKIAKHIQQLNVG